MLARAPTEAQLQSSAELTRSPCPWTPHRAHAAVTHVGQQGQKMPAWGRTSPWGQRWAEATGQARPEPEARTGRRQEGARPGRRPCKGPQGRTGRWHQEKEPQDSILLGENGPGPGPTERIPGGPHSPPPPPPPWLLGGDREGCKIWALSQAHTQVVKAS